MIINYHEDDETITKIIRFHLLLENQQGTVLIPVRSEIMTQYVPSKKWTLIKPHTQKHYLKHDIINLSKLQLHLLHCTFTMLFEYLSHCIQFDCFT